MSGPGATIAWLKRYLAANDPRVADANLIAAILAWNTPLYPVYLVALGGWAELSAGLRSLPVLPFLVLVPAATRRFPLAGRIYLDLICIANTLFAAWVSGPESGAGLFLLPCVSLAGLLFGPEERVPLLIFLGLPLLLGALIDGRYPASPFVCDGPACLAIWRMNMGSAAVLLAFFGYRMASRRPSRSDGDRSRDPARGG